MEFQSSTRRHLISALCLVAFVLPVFAETHPGKLHRDLRDLNPDETVNVIVRFKQSPSVTTHARMGIRGAAFRHNLDIIQSGAYQVPVSALVDLESDPDVEFIGPDRPVYSTLDSAEPAINANKAFASNYTGRGVSIAVIDSGIMPSDDIASSRILYNQSFLSGGNDYFDRYGHGSHIAGILAGNAADSSGAGYTRVFRGIAPGVNLVNLRVLDANGQGTDSAVIAAIQAAIQLKSTYNIRVINLSLGRPVFESYTVDPLCKAVEQAWKAGIVVVVAAGNEGRNNTAKTQGYATITAPGNDPYVITVGAMKDMGTPARSDDQMASYSSKGPTAFDHIAKPDLVAPGNPRDRSTSGWSHVD